MPRLRVPILLALVALTASGCGGPPAVRKYTIPKETRRLAALFPGRFAYWSFKMEGPPDRVALLRDDFVAFLKTVSVDSDGIKPPTWKLPKHWQEKNGTPPRIKTITASPEPATGEETGDSQQSLEISVLVISGPPVPGEDDAYVLANVNRWRTQLQLPEVDKLGEAAGTEPLIIGDEFITLVDITGSPDRDVMKHPIIIEAIQQANQPVQKAIRSGPPTYELPEGWQKAGAVQFATYAFHTGEEEGSARVTVSDVGGALGENINRWRRQVGLPQLSTEQLVPTIEEIIVDDHRSMLISLEGTAGKSMVVVIVPILDSQWIIKLSGTTEQVLSENEHFVEFVESLDFLEKGGATDGE